MRTSSEYAEFRQFHGQRALVTGGAGFVGSNVAHRLVELGAEVVVLDDLSTGRLELIPSGVARFRQGSVADIDVVRRAMHGVAFVFHLAVQNIILSTTQPLRDCTVNIGGTLNVLLAASEAAVPPAIMYASSASIYGNARTLPTREDSMPDVISPYAASKLAGESYCHAFSAMYGLPVSILRYSNVYGRNQSPANPYCGVISKFLAACMEGRPMRIHGSGLQTRDFTYVDDAVEATLLAAITPQARGQAVNIGSGHETDIRRLAQLVANAANVPCNIEFVEKRDIDKINRRVMDIERARQLLDWGPRISLEAGLKRTYKWLRDYAVPAGRPRSGLVAAGSRDQ